MLYDARQFETFTEFQMYEGSSTFLKLKNVEGSKRSNNFKLCLYLEGSP